LLVKQKNLRLKLLLMVMEKQKIKAGENPVDIRQMKS